MIIRLERDGNFVGTPETPHGGMSFCPHRFGVSSGSRNADLFATFVVSECRGPSRSLHARETGNQL